MAHNIDSTLAVGLEADTHCMSLLTVVTTHTSRVTGAYTSGTTMLPYSETSTLHVYSSFTLLIDIVYICTDYTPDISYPDKNDDVDLCINLLFHPNRYVNGL